MAIVSERMDRKTVASLLSAMIEKETDALCEIGPWWGSCLLPKGLMKTVTFKQALKRLRSMLWFVEVNRTENKFFKRVIRQAFPAYLLISECSSTLFTLLFFFRFFIARSQQLMLEIFFSIACWATERATVWVLERRKQQQERERERERSFLFGNHSTLEDSVAITSASIFRN